MRALRSLGMTTTPRINFIQTCQVLRILHLTSMPKFMYVCPFGHESGSTQTQLKSPETASVSLKRSGKKVSTVC